MHSQRLQPIYSSAIESIFSIKIFYVALLFIICMNVTYTQTMQKKVPLLFEPFISVGYLDISSNLSSEYYNLILNSYRSADIPIPNQNNFGSTFATKGGVYFSLSEKVSTGFALGYMYSNASSSYEALKVNGDIQSYSFTVVGKIKLTKTYFPLILFVEAGSNYSTSAIEENITDHPENNSNTRWFVETWGPRVLAAIGTDIKLGILTFTPQVGYNVSMNYVSSEVNKNIYIKYGTNLNNNGNIGQSGLIFLIKFGINFQKDRNSL